MDLSDRAKSLVDLHAHCKRTRFLLLILAVSTSCGCGTIGTRMFDDPAKSGDYHGSKIYSGVRGDIQAVGDMLSPNYTKEARGLWPLFLLDLPFSFIADTLLLPITIYEELSKSSEQKKEATPINPSGLNSGQPTGK